jgi:hypothetical protein
LAAKHLRPGLAVATAFLFFLTTVQAQIPEVPSTETVLDFEFFPEATFRPVALVGTTRGPFGPVSDVASFDFSIKDFSVDPTTVPNKPATEHQIRFRIEWLNSSRPTESCWDGDNQWCYDDGTSILQTYTGQTVSGLKVTLKHTPSVTIPEAGVRLTANMTLLSDPNRVYKEKSIDFFARILPSPSLQAQIIYPGSIAGIPGAPQTAPPDTWITIPVIIQNTDLYLQQLRVQVLVSPGEGVDPSVIPVRGDIGAVVDPLDSKILNVSFKTPKARTYYGSTSLTYTVRAFNANQPDVRFDSTSVVAIQGFYISTPLKVVTVLLIVLLILFFLVVFRGKRYYEETVLGKPIPPWRIKAEAAALETLRKSDPRKFYITRYFLMEEEYESALNWFYGYKRRTKKGLKREARSAELADKAALLKAPDTTKFDDRAERLKIRMRRRQERQRLKLEAKLTKLQNKVDLHYEEDFEKDHEKWEKKVERIKAKANRPWFKARKKWEREVERLMEAWEKPFAKDKKNREKEIEAAKEKYAKQVKKKDKETWLAWREAVEAAEAENSIREKEGRTLLPEPELSSSVVGPADIPKPFKEPPKPKLPPEPVEPVVKDLPPEPKLVAPKLDESHYARKARRARKKADRKIKRLERKLERMLAKNERDRVKSIAKKSRKREKLLRKSHRVTQPTLTERLFRNTPEDRERRAHKKLLKALAKERVKAMEESEKARLDVLMIEVQRREAELVSKLVREQAEVRRQGGTASMRVDEAPELLSLRETNQARLFKERAAAEQRIQAEKARAQDELRRQLTEELVKERAERERLQIQKAEAAKAKALEEQAAKEASDSTKSASKPPKPSKKAPEAKRGKK